MNNEQGAGQKVAEANEYTVLKYILEIQAMRLQSQGITVAYLPGTGDLECKKDGDEVSIITNSRNGENNLHVYVYVRNGVVNVSFAHKNDLHELNLEEGKDPIYNHGPHRAGLEFPLEEFRRVWLEPLDMFIEGL